MCEAPCATCSANNFYSCLSCSDTSQTLTADSLCLTPTTMVYQIVTTSLMIFFIVPVLLRKRSLVLVKILDLIQIASYFKFIVGYNKFRHVWLYLNMRSWGTWEQGWQIIEGDPGPMIWTTEEGNFDKLIRIASTWGLFVVIIVFLAIIKVVLSDVDLTFVKFMKMNITNTLTYAFYFTLQDLSFFVAVSLLNPTFSSTTNEIVCFSLAIGLGILIVIYITYCFYRINFNSGEPSQKLYPYKYFFLFAADYDIFPTYNLTQVPKSKKQIHKFSNLRVIDCLKKVIYSFLIVHFLVSSTSYTYLDEVYQLLAFIIFFQLLWFIVFPFDFRKQFPQVILMIVCEGIVLYLLFAPWYVDSEVAHIVLVLVLFGMAILSVAFEVCLDVYKLVPVDLYETGMKVVIEDARLIKELAMRKKEQEEVERKLKEMQEEKRRLEEEKNKSVKNNEPVEQMAKNQSEMSLSQNTLNPGKNSERMPKLIQSDAIQRQSMNSEEIAQLYKIDELKRRKVYEWDKKKPFTYSNKIE